MFLFGEVLEYQLINPFSLQFWHFIKNFMDISSLLIKCPKRPNCLKSLKCPTCHNFLNCPKCLKCLKGTWTDTWKLVFRKEFFIWSSMPIFSFIGHTVTELFRKPGIWRQIYKQANSTFYTSNDVSRRKNYDTS